MKIPDGVAFRAFTMAQALAPFDTGNLKFNAMDLIILPNGFEIRYDSNFAHYLKWVEEGKTAGGTSDKNKFFIKHKTVGQVAGYLQNALNGKTALATRHHKLVTNQSLKNLEAREDREVESIMESTYNNRYY